MSETTDGTILPPASDLPPLLPAIRDTPLPATWAEVFAVLCIGVFPLLPSILSQPHQTVYPYWVDSVQLAVSSGCMIFAVLYLMRRSGTEWTYFGLSRPKFRDLPLAIVMLFIAEMIWSLQMRFEWYDPKDFEAVIFAFPQTTAERAMMVGKYLLSAFSEELICRAYLITRLTVLFRSRLWAVWFSSVAFCSYHAYQGLTGVIYTFLFGLAFGTAFLVLPRIWPFALGHALVNMRIDLAGP